MGFLLGKSHEALQEFDTTGQDLKFNSFPILDRSINKSLQAYQFREKAEIEYVFSFLSDSDHGNLTKLLLDRNSLREGQILLPIPYSENSSKCIYTFEGITSPSTIHKAFYFESSNPSWDLTLAQLQSLTGSGQYYTEFSTTYYNWVSYYDTNIFLLNPASDKYCGVVLQFKLTDFLSSFSNKELRRITLITHGMVSSPIRFFAYDLKQDDWYLLADRYYYNDADFAKPGFHYYKQLIGQLSCPWGSTTLYNDFVSSSDYLTLMIACGKKGQPIEINWLRLLVNGFWVFSSESDIENFETSFTGAGRTGTIKFLEI